MKNEVSLAEQIRQNLINQLENMKQKYKALTNEFLQDSKKQEVEHTKNL